MDPDFFRNSLSSRYPQDFTSLFSEQSGLSQGQSLGSAFPSSALQSSRSLGPVPGYAGHALHTPSLENHFASIQGQNSYKPLQVGQPTFSDPYASLRLQQSGTNNSKLMFQQDSAILKDVSSYATTVPQSNSIDVSQKTWGLSNFVSQNHNLYSHAADLSGLDYTSVSLPSQGVPLNPPPAHSSKPGPILQRNMYNSPDMFLSRSTKSPPAIHSMFDPRSHTGTPGTSHPSLFTFSQTNAYPVKSEINNIYSNSDSMNYEAVSPATPETHTQGSDSYSSLQDLASISSTQQKLDVNIHQKHVQERQQEANIHQKHVHDHQLDANIHQKHVHDHQLDANIHQKHVQERQLDVNIHHKHVQERQLDMNIHQKHFSEQQNKPPQNQKSGSRNLRQDIFSGQNNPLGQIKQSPQPSPISVGGSPQMQIGSPITPIPSSTVVQAPPPVQAPADSTTKPKKGRGRKKKDSVINEFKPEPGTQVYSPQTFSSSPEIQHRGSSSEFLNGQQHNFVQNRNNQQLLSSASLVDHGHSSSPLMTSMNQSYSKNPNQSVFVKNENQSIVVNHQPQACSQPSMMGLQSTPSTSHSNMPYSISGALEMSREAVFSNQEIMQGYNSNELSNYAMPEGFTNQLVERPIDGIVRHNQDLFNGQEEPVYNVTNAYGGQFVSPNSVLNMDLGQNSQQGNQSTIDEAAFSSLMEESFRENVQEKRFKGENLNNAKLPYVPLTATLEAENDEDLSHLAGPVVVKKDCKPAIDQPQMNFQPPSNPRPEIRNASGGGSFMDSFMSFLQGKKPETLSSMSSAIIHNKPQLPKYIPEPRRPRPIVLEDSAKKSGDSQSSSLANSDMAFTDDEDDDTLDTNTKNVVEDAISNLSNEDHSVRFSTNKTGGLTMKINLSKVKKAEEDAKHKSKSKKSPKSKKKGKEKEQPVFGLKDAAKAGPPTLEEQEMLPLRQLSARKAKENKGKYVDTDSDSDTLKPIRKPGDESEGAYDSDMDPVWKPVSLEKKNNADNSDAAKKKRVRKPRSKPLKSRKVSGDKAVFNQHEVVELDSDTTEEEVDLPAPTEDLKVGDFVIDTKDFKNFESYPVWRIESGRMLHKFELFTENSRILHRAIPTFSSWLPTMLKSLRRIHVNTVLKQGEKEHVEVHEQYRPRPMIDSKLEEKYEEHPLVEPFNVYIQTFLSQALEPGFLSAICESNERFYLDSLDKIDESLSKHLMEIDQKVMWKSKFKEAVMTRPHIRELDRPNLKQSCQACEYASQPAIKSVHLFGNPYNKLSLIEDKSTGNQESQEFMIGKTASKFVGPYHKLFHFKYNLYKRCQAKVKIVHETDRTLDNAAILDQCLQNRAWVLQIFEDLKKLLEKG